MSRWRTRVEEAKGTSCSKKLFLGLLEAQTEREREEKVVRQHLLNLPQNKIVVLIKKRKLFLTLKKAYIIPCLPIFGWLLSEGLIQMINFFPSSFEGVT